VVRKRFCLSPCSHPQRPGKCGGAVIFEPLNNDLVGIALFGLRQKKESLCIEEMAVRVTNTARLLVFMGVFLGLVLFAPSPNKAQTENIGLSAQPEADLTVYKPENWLYEIPIEVTQLQWDQDQTYSGPYYSDQVLYFNWGSLNQGDAKAIGYTVRVEVTGGGGIWEWNNITTDPVYWTFLVNGQAVGPLSQGSHTFKLWLDYYGDIGESNEMNNYYERTITVVGNGLGEIRGSKWRDDDGDGERDGGEIGIEGWTIYLDENLNGQFDNAEPNTLTDENGDYSFPGLSPGMYVVGEATRQGWIQTYPAGTQPQAAGVRRMRAMISPLTTTTGSHVPIYRYGEIVRTEQAGLLPASAESGPLINMEDFRSDERFEDVAGSGYAAVVIDTGIDLDHPFFGPDSNADGVADRIVYNYDFADGDNNASDFHGHGSNVASILSSQDETYTGMAPGVNIIALKVFTDSGEGNFGYVEQALQWVLQNALAYNIVSVNISLGDEENWATTGSHYGIGDELASLKAMNVIVVSASGNSFFEYGSTQGVSYPAADASSLSVGAVYDAATGGWTYSGGAIAYSTEADRIAPFSQRHAVLTTVFAPGAVITGANKNGGTVNMHGTSQASPHIAGIAVLAQELADDFLGRRLTAAEFAGLVNSTGVLINDGDDEDDNVANTGLDFRRVDMLALAEAIVAMSVTDSHMMVLEAGQTLDGVDFGNGHDCNNNGLVDGVEIAQGASQDANGNGIPDECESCQTCAGDMTGDGWLSPNDISELVSLLLPAGSSYYWMPAPIGQCGDMNADGWLSPGDVSELVSAVLPYASAYYWLACPQQ